ncbi:MAG: hypothetical protein MH204_00750 [Fimbriimonadaceae bacterium]|nr:hypothetical protein [Fimbriimonadaceae bacterium]
MNRRTFSESEAAELLQAAVKLQESSAEGMNAYTPGITREELENIAKEAGIQPKYLEAALAQLHKPKPEQHSTRRGLIAKEERVVDGDLSPDDFGEILKGITPNVTGANGLRQIGRTLEGSFTKQMAMFKVAVTSRLGRTRISVENSPVLDFISSAYPIGIVSTIAAMGIGTEQSPVLGALVGAVGLLLATGSFLALNRRSRRRAAELADQIVGNVEGAIQERQAASPAPQTAPATETDEVRLHLGDR